MRPNSRTGYPVAVDERIAGNGRLSKGEHSVTVASFTMVRQKYAARASWGFAAHIAVEHLSRLKAVLREKSGPLMFDGETDNGEQLHIPALDGWSLSHGRFESEAREVLRDLHDHIDSVKSQFVAIRLTPCWLAQPELDGISRVPHSDGQIRPFDGESVIEHDVPVVDLATLPFRLSVQYGYDNVDVAGREGLLRVPVPSLTCELDGADQCRADVLAFSREIEASSGDVLRVLSFLNRSFVRWARIEIASTREGVGLPYIRGVWDRTAVIEERATSLEYLVNPYRMPVDGINRTVKAFRALPERKAVGASIVYLTAALEAQHLETRLTSAFTALESLVQGLGERDKSDLTLRAGPFKKLAGVVRDQIRAFGVAKNLPEDTVREMCEKVAEIQRRPIVPRVVELVERLGIDWRDIWPSAATLKEPLESCYKRRNRFIHRGEFPPPQDAFVDARRIHALTERMIFRLLDGDPAWQAGHEYRHLKGLTNTEPEAAVEDATDNDD